jgi:cyclase
MSAAAVDDATLVTRTADAVGRQSVVVVLDVRKKSGLFSKGYEVFTRNGKQAQKGDPFEIARKMQEAGAGEIVINSIDRDGQMKGYDLALAARMRQELRVPLTLLGGAGSHQDIEALLGDCGVVGASAGSLFVFKGPYRAVLINYPNPEQKDRICSSGLAAFSTK